MRTILSVLSVFILGSAAALADSTGEARLREALRSATGQLRALEDEQSRWQAKEAKYKEELDSLHKALASARKAAARKGTDASAKKECEGKLEAIDQRLAEQSRSGAALTESLAQCQKSAREADQAARAKEDERARMAGQVDGLTARAAACEARNLRLYQVGKEIVDWLGNLGAGVALCEPFLGFKRVEVENKAQDYQDRLLEQRIDLAK